MKFIPDQIADVCTQHITARDGELILDPAAPSGLAVEWNLYGAFFTTNEITSDPKGGYDGLKAFGFSDEFCAILKEAGAQGFRYVRFHDLGADVDGAPTFDW